MVSDFRFICTDRTSKGQGCGNVQVAGKDAALIYMQPEVGEPSMNCRLRCPTCKYVELVPVDSKQVTGILKIIPNIQLVHIDIARVRAQEGVPSVFSPLTGNEVSDFIIDINTKPAQEVINAYE